MWLCFVDYSATGAAIALDQTDRKQAIFAIFFTIPSVCGAELGSKVALQPTPLSLGSETLNPKVLLSALYPKQTGVSPKIQDFQ